MTISQWFSTLFTMTLESKLTVLCPLEENDVPLLTKWLLDPQIKQWLQLSEDPPEYCNEEAVGQRFHAMKASPCIELWRIDTRQGRPIGQIEIVDIRPLHGRAEMHMLIGECELQGQGYGTDALRRTLRHAFESLNLHRIHCIVDADNSRAIRCYEKAGFAREGLLRQHRLRFGKTVDMLAMGVLRSL